MPLPRRCPEGMVCNMEINKPVSGVIIIIITLIIVFLFALPQYEESKELQAKVAEKNAEYNGKSIYYQKISDLMLELENKQVALKKVESALPIDFSIASVAYFLQKKASESGLIIKSFNFSDTVSPNSAEQNKAIKDISFNIDLAGNYQGLKNFLYSLEKSSRIFEINTISFASLAPPQTGQPVKNPLPVYNFKLEIKTHSY